MKKKVSCLVALALTLNLVGGSTSIKAYAESVENLEQTVIEQNDTSTEGENSAVEEGSELAEDLVIGSNLTLNEDVKCKNLKITGGTLDLNGYSLTVLGNVEQTGGTLKVNEGKLLIDGDYTQSESGKLFMNNENDYALVGGNLLISSNISSSSYYTNGILEVKGNVTQKRTSNQFNFLQTGNFKVVFSGEKEQIVNIENPSNSKFNLIDTSKSVAVKFETPICISNLEAIENLGHAVGTVKLISTTINLTKDTYIPYELELQSSSVLNLNGYNLYTLQDVKTNGGKIDSSKGGSIIVQKTPIKEDVNNDGVVDMLDLSTIADKYGALEGEENFDIFMDQNGDGKIDIIDIVKIAKVIE